MTSNNGNGKTSDRHFAIQTGVVYPLEFLNHIQQLSTLSELKIVAAIYGYDGIVGIESEPLRFGDLLERTGLSRRSLARGLKKCCEAQIVNRVDDNGDAVYTPAAKSKLHVHDHVVFKPSSNLNHDRTNEHVHAAKGKPRQKLHRVLLTEFGMSMTATTQRVAADLALSPKYNTDRIEAQIRYTRWEQKHGEDGDPSRPIRNPAGRLVNRLRRNLPAPAGFDLVEHLTEIENWDREQLYEAVYSGQIEAKEIEESFGYINWTIDRFEESEASRVAI